MKKPFFFLIAVFIIQTAFAGSVDTATIYSSCMHKNIKCVIIKPESYSKKQLHFPVVYLLHGYSDRYDTWIKNVPALKDYADMMQLIMVCPDGGYSSWYFDSPIDSAFKYDTHISREVVTYIDRYYRTIPDRGHRAVAGLSMGGHGALYLALRHPDIFGAAGSMSGGVDLRPFPAEWDIAKRLGDIRSNTDNWQNRSVINMAGHYSGKPLAIMVDCGTDDFFCQVNQQFHKKLLEMKMPHDFVERPGKHDWEYWSNAVEFQLVFFSKAFAKPRN
ncbi:MAG: alpha/beta hydrolase family protein [Bacteroidota bacterium]